MLEYKYSVNASIEYDILENKIRGYVQNFVCNTDKYQWSENHACERAA